MFCLHPINGFTKAAIKMGMCDTISIIIWDYYIYENLPVIHVSWFDDQLMKHLARTDEVCEDGFQKEYSRLLFQAGVENEDNQANLKTTCKV